MATRQVDDAQAPHAERKSRRSRIIHQKSIVVWAAITLSGLYYLVILPFRASLVGTHPVALVLLNGSTEGIVSGAAFARQVSRAAGLVGAGPTEGAAAAGEREPAQLLP